MLHGRPWADVKEQLPCLSDVVRFLFLKNVSDSLCCGTFEGDLIVCRETRKEGSAVVHARDYA